jgi:hypothetical protein
MVGDGFWPPVRAELHGVVLAQIHGVTGSIRKTESPLKIGKVDLPGSPITKVPMRPGVTAYDAGLGDPG